MRWSNFNDRILGGPAGRWVRSILDWFAARVETRMETRERVSQPMVDEEIQRITLADQEQFLRDCVIMEFVGGPLDGPQPVHPAQNYIVYVKENPEGFYRSDGFKYWWVPRHPSPH
jgi:hypothetical protein